MACFAFGSTEQSVFKLSCADKTFEILAKAFNPNEAGTSNVERIYRYNSKILPSLCYEKFFWALSDFLALNPASTATFPLRLPPDTQSYPGGYYERGDTVYLPKTDFSEKDFQQLATCLQTNFSTLRTMVERAEVTQKHFFGLWKTKSKFGVNGIARLIYADPPIVRIYSDWGEYLVVTNHLDIYHGKIRPNPKSEHRKLVGKVQNSSGKMKILMDLKYLADPANHNVETLKQFPSTSGSLFGDDYDLITPKTP